MKLRERKRNTPIATLIRDYVNKNSGKVSKSREEIKWRFDYLDWKDQKKIINAFLASGKCDREWAYLCAYENWDKSFEPKIKELWEKYYEAVKTVARIEDNEGSYLLFYYAVLEQAIRLRHESIYNLLQNLQGKHYKFSKTRFTKKMIEESYKSFRESISEANELYYPNDSAYMAEHKESLKEEEKCWNEWVAYRFVVSSKLPENLRSVYDGCTNLTIREKLRQVKNQNQALGVTGDEPWNCILPKECSDKALLEYPGFDKVWAKHCKNLDWYPTFK